MPVLVPDADRRWCQFAANTISKDLVEEGNLFHPDQRSWAAEVIEEALYRVLNEGNRPPIAD